MEPSPNYLSYIVRPGDSLSGIQQKMWDIPPNNPRRREAGLAHLMAVNPEIKNPNLIHPGQTIRIPAMTLAEMDRMCQIQPTPATRQRLQPTIQNLQPVIPLPSNPQDQDAFWAMAWLEHSANWLTNPGGVLTGAAGNLFHPGTNALVGQLEQVYHEYKAGSLTKGQYDYRRRQLLKEFARRIGPVERLLFGGRTAPEAIRIARAGGVPATDKIARQVHRLNRLTNIAKHGGILLTGVGLAAGCMQIASAKTQDEKNEIFVETMGSAISGGLVGAGVSLFLLSNPVGWGVSLVLAAGAVATSYGAGKVSRWVYDNHLHGVDFVGATRTDALCR